MRTPQIGDIWKDRNGHFLVTEEHELSDYDRKANGYVCEISSFDFSTGKHDGCWAVSERELKELIFVA